MTGSNKLNRTNKRVWYANPGKGEKQRLEKKMKRRRRERERREKIRAFGLGGRAYLGRRGH